MLAGKRSAMTKTVLIVEDNELNMKLFNDLLEAHGYKTVQVRDGLTALDLAREHRPDLDHQGGRPILSPHSVEPLWRTP